MNNKYKRFWYLKYFVRYDRFSYLFKKKQLIFLYFIAFYLLLFFFTLCEKNSLRLWTRFVATTRKEWLLRSCDLTHYDLFSWSYIKSQVHVNKLQTIPELNREIHRIIGDINRDVCQRIVVNFPDWITSCGENVGGHMPDIVFHN